MKNTPDKNKQNPEEIAKYNSVELPPHSLESDSEIYDLYNFSNGSNQNDEYRIKESQSNIQANYNGFGWE